MVISETKQDLSLIAHLLRRAGFGVTREELEKRVGKSYDSVVDELFKNAYNIFYPILYGNQYEMSKIQMEYGGVYSIPTSFLIDKYGEVIRVYPGAILKQFNPSMYTDLVMNIENALLK